MRRIHFVLAFALVGAVLTPAQISVTLTPSQPAPVPLGAIVTFAASASGINLGSPTFRFRSRLVGAPFHTIVDYGPNSSLSWTTIDREGSYEIEVTARSGDLTQTAAASVIIAMSSLITQGAPVITPTANPLVFLYSAPACPPRQTLSVQFTSPEGYVQSTPSRPCTGFSMNFYLAGMRPQAQYSVQHLVTGDTSTTTGPTLSLPTPSVALQAPTMSALTSSVSTVDGILLQSPFVSGAIATDLNGNIVWYYAGNISYLTNPVTGGTFMGLAENPTGDPSQQFFREFDLAGVTLAETNGARVNEQLAVMGVHPIAGFHHDVRKLPNGDYLVLADSERILTDIQGPGPVDIIGDTILVLDANLQVVWTWDAFDHLDPHRAALLGETCIYPAGFSCGVFYLAPVANDWLHGNSVQLTPDGNILYSARHQDWVIKIDYENGAGSGNILWRLGAQGDFKLAAGDPRVAPLDPHPWFSHQHDPTFGPNDSALTLYDNGNTRIAADPSGHSRGQALRINEKLREARLILNADLGVFSSAVGSAQHLPNGDYHFDSGFLAFPPGSTNFAAQSVEVNAQGQIVYGLQIGTLEYRTFRMPDLYTAP